MAASERKRAGLGAEIVMSNGWILIRSRLGESSAEIEGMQSRGNRSCPSTGMSQSQEMDSYFSELGGMVYDRWKQLNFAPEAFPEIATAVLVERPPADNVNLPELVREFLLEDTQPVQSTSGFGQPELIVYDTPRFYIQVLFWMEGTTDIHQHAFSGAFHVMEGSSLHSLFEFEDAESITSHFRVGNLKLKESHLLETGATMPIVSGAGCIHSLFHLDSPSVSIVIRTHSDPSCGPQFTYLPPHLAVDPVQNDGLTLRRKQLLDLLEQTGDPEYADLVIEMIRELDFERGFFILQNGIGHLRNLGVWAEAWEAFALKHGPLADAVPPTLEEIIRRDGIAAMRGMIGDPDHRFFLALLLNVEDGKSLLEMVGLRYGGASVDMILQWAEELMQVTESGTWMIDAEFPDELGIVQDEQPELFLEALRYFLNPENPPANISSGDLEVLRKAFERSSWRALVNS